MTRGVSGKVNMLSKRERIKKVKEGRSRGTVRLVDMKVEISSDDNFGGRSDEIFKESGKFRVENGFRGGRGTVYGK